MLVFDALSSHFCLSNCCSLVPQSFSHPDVVEVMRGILSNQSQSVTLQPPAEQLHTFSRKAQERLDNSFSHSIALYCAKLKYKYFQHLNIYDVKESKFKFLVYRM